jgi:hypothetical protein
MRQTRHKSTEVALGYLRPADLWRNNVTERVFQGDGTGGERDTRGIPQITRRIRVLALSCRPATRSASVIDDR